MKPNRKNLSTNQIITILLRDQFTCQQCGLTAQRGTDHASLQIHHLIPRSQGGSNDPDNLTTLCSPCHTKADNELIHTGSKLNHPEGRRITLPETIDPNTILTMVELADLLSISRQRVHELIKNKRLPAEMVAGRWMVRAGDVHQFQIRKAGRPLGRHFDPEREKKKAKARELREQGITYKAIAQILNVSKETVFNWLKETTPT